MVHPGKEEFLRHYPHFGITADSSTNVEVKVTDPLQGRKFKYQSALLGFLGGLAQWWGIHLPGQETQVRSLVWEDPTGSGSVKSVCHNHWACVLKSLSCNYWAHALQLLKPEQLEPVLHNKRSNRHEKPTDCNEERAPLAASREKPIEQLKPNRVKYK